MIAPPTFPLYQHASAKFPTIAILDTVAHGRAMSAVNCDKSVLVGGRGVGACVGACVGGAVGQTGGQL